MKALEPLNRHLIVAHELGKRPENSPGFLLGMVMVVVEDILSRLWSEDVGLHQRGKCGGSKFRVVCNAVTCSGRNFPLRRPFEVCAQVSLVGFVEVLHVILDFVHVCLCELSSNHLLFDAELIDVDSSVLFKCLRLMLVEPSGIGVRVILWVRSFD